LEQLTEESEEEEKADYQTDLKDWLKVVQEN
jgi:hypothetical protein